MSAITLKNVRKIYEGNDFYSVTDFNLEIEEGEFIVFVGPSGCGKSTTLRMIAGLEEISEGELIMRGNVVNDVPPKDRDIAMVFQNYALYPHMSVFDNMAFGLKLRKYPKDEIKRRVEEAAEVLGLADLLERRPAALSGGQRQRVALGRAIVRDAQTFLMDEPLSNLDAKLRVQMRTEITRLHRQLGTTTIYVTHDQTEAMTMASRIVVLRDGFIQQVGTPHEVYDTPNNMFVASFIGAPAMNFLELTYEDGWLTNDQSIRLKVSAPDQKLLEERGYAGQRVVLGIRPEHIMAENIALETSPDTIVQSRVVVSEMTGAETILYMETDDEQFIARIDVRDEQAPDEVIPLMFNMTKAHFFDPESEAIIR